MLSAETAFSFFGLKASKHPIRSPIKSLGCLPCQLALLCLLRDVPDTEPGPLKIYMLTFDIRANQKGGGSAGFVIAPVHKAGNQRTINTRVGPSKKRCAAAGKVALVDTAEVI